MEFDILNEILTGTVASLFTDFNKHRSYTKNSSQLGQDKSEIPISSSSTKDLMQALRSSGTDYQNLVN